MSRRVCSSLLSTLAVALLVGSAAAKENPPQQVGQLATIKELELLPALQRATDVGAAQPDQSLTVAVSFDFAKPEEAKAFIDSVSNPLSPDYRHFLTPEQVGERFGQPIERLQAMAAYLGQRGFTIDELGQNRLAVVARGTVAQCEQAFHTTIRAFTVAPADEWESAAFIAPATALRLPAELTAGVLDISGVDTYVHRRPFKQLLNPFLTRSLYNCQPIFNNGMTGDGRVLGISNFDGFRSSNWPLYISHFTLPVPAGGVASNIITVPVSGGGAGAGGAGGEGDLDIQMQLGMAPLATIRIYDSPPNSNLIAVLSAEANDNQCDAISESYGWSLPTTTAKSAHNQHVSMTAEGITYMAASGDSGTTVDPFGYPAGEPEVLSIGGTNANVDPVTGVRMTEVNWTGGGGGWSIKAPTFNFRPSWQVGTGVPAINASNNFRLIPDVAFHSSGPSGAYNFYQSNVLTSGIGTSFAAPIFAGMLQLVSLKVISEGGLVPDNNGHRRFGRINDLIYSQNNDPAIWFDIASGASNGQLPSAQGSSTPHAGWDTCVGWGPMNCDAFADAVVCATGGCSGPWTNIGFGLAGVGGIPSLVGTGTLATNSSDSLALTSARPLSPAVLFVSFTSSPIPFKGGTLAAFPFFTTVSLGTDASGSITLPFVWPAGPPSGFSVFFQYAVQDAASVHGASLSNCERGITP